MDKTNLIFDTLKHDILFLTDLWSKEQREEFAQKFIEWATNDYEKDMDLWLEEKWQKK